MKSCFTVMEGNIIVFVTDDLLRIDRFLNVALKEKSPGKYFMNQLEMGRPTTYEGNGRNISIQQTVFIPYEEHNE